MRTTNTGIAALALLVGPVEMLKLQAPIVLLAASAGIWLFHVQHEFEASYWRRDRSWSFYQAALQGSSFYCLPRPLHWLTASIGLHHIHHLCSRIPNYRPAGVRRRPPRVAAGASGHAGRERSLRTALLVERGLRSDDPVPGLAVQVIGPTLKD